MEWTEVGISRIDYRDAPVAEGDVPPKYAEPLAAYFAGEDVDPITLPIDPVGTEFQLRVWAALRTIPRGSVVSYSSIARSIDQPRAMRAVGTANGKNPISIVVPCHRVVAAGFELGGYTGGLDRKRTLLTLEGVKVNGSRVLPGQLDLF